MKSEFYIQPATTSSVVRQEEASKHFPKPNLHEKMFYHVFKHLNKFLQGKCFHNQQEAENAFQEFVLKHGFLHYRNKHLFLIGKNLLIVMVPILINKDVFQPSHNDLKFTV